MTEHHLQVAIELSRAGLRAGEPMRLTVKGKSMLPLLRDGDGVWVEEVPQDSLRRGDLVVVELNQELIVHRLVSIDQTSWSTKGDHVIHLDPVQNPGQLVGRVVTVDLPDKRLDVNREPWRIINRWLGGISYLEAQVCGWFETRSSSSKEPEQTPWVKYGRWALFVFTRTPFELVKYAWR